MVKSMMFLITFTVFLVLFVIKFDQVVHLVMQLLDLLQPMIIGFAIAFVLNRPCNFFYRQYRRLAGNAKLARLARPMAVATSYLALILILTGIISLIVPQVAHSIETLINNMNGYLRNLQGLYNDLMSRLDLTVLEGLDFTDLNETLKGMLNNALTTLTSAVPQVLEVTGSLISAVITFVMSVVFSVYMLAGGRQLTSQCRRLVQAYLPEKVSSTLISVTRLTAETFTNFVTGQLVEACIIGTLCFIGMLLLGFNYPDLISVIIGVSALLPIVGAYLGAILSAILLIIVDPMEAVWFLIFLVILQQFEGNVIYPRVAGSIIGLPGLWVLAAITVGGGLFDLVGMLVGVPVAAVLYTLLRQDLLRREGKLAPESGKSARRSRPKPKADDQPPTA